MQDLLRDFEKPAVMDVKMGTRGALVFSVYSLLLRHITRVHTRQQTYPYKHTLSPEAGDDSVDACLSIP